MNTPADACKPVIYYAGILALPQPDCPPVDVGTIGGCTLHIVEKILGDQVIAAETQSPKPMLHHGGSHF